MGFRSAQSKFFKTVAVIFWLSAATGSQAGPAGKASSVPAADGEALIAVNVYHLVVDPASRQPVVTLVDMEKKRAFPIWIGLSEARAIHSELQGVEHFRPLTHDLLGRIIDRVDAKINRVVITRVQDNVFYATLVMTKDGSLIEIDARPSDAIVMALKFDAPIYINRSLFEIMSIPLEAPQAMGGDYGLNLQEITPELAGYLSLESSPGVMVSAVRPGSRAARDGFHAGDVLVEIDGQPIADLTSAKDQLEKIKGPTTAKLIRENQILTITLHDHLK